jgi:RNA ligase (TIGR02306 family)
MDSNKYDINTGEEKMYTYERDIAHCEVSPYVKKVTVKEQVDAANSDNLSLLSFEEIGWFCVDKKGEHKPGDKVLVIPPDSVLPVELSEELQVTKYLSKGRVRITRFRGNRSEGLAIPTEYEKWIPFIYKWEDPPSIHMQGETLSRKEVPFIFEKFYKMPNILNEPHIFKIGEVLLYSEKIHGTNLRTAKLQHPETNEYQTYVGSHEIVLKESDKNLYWITVKKILEQKLPKDIVFYAEIFGPGIQHLLYGRKKPDVMIFAAAGKSDYRAVDYLPHEEVVKICDKSGIPHVTFHELVFESLEQIRQLADGNSEYTEDHYREGVVLVSKEHPDRMAKCIGFEYLQNKGQKKKRTERH